MNTVMARVSTLPKYVTWINLEENFRVTGDRAGDKSLSFHFDPKSGDTVVVDIDAQSSSSSGSSDESDSDTKKREDALGPSSSGMRVGRKYATSVDHSPQPLVKGRGPPRKLKRGKMVYYDILDGVLGIMLKEVGESRSADIVAYVAAAMRLPERLVRRRLSANIEARKDALRAEEAEREGLDNDRPLDQRLDSFRSLFCMRCFTYDCRMHGGGQPMPGRRFPSSAAPKHASPNPRVKAKALALQPSEPEIKFTSDVKPHPLLAEWEKRELARRSEAHKHSCGDACFNNVRLHGPQDEEALQGRIDKMREECRAAGDAWRQLDRDVFKQLAPIMGKDPCRICVVMGMAGRKFTCRDVGLYIERVVLEQEERRAALAAKALETDNADKLEAEKKAAAAKRRKERLAWLKRNVGRKSLKLHSDSNSKVSLKRKFMAYKIKRMFNFAQERHWVKYEPCNHDGVCDRECKMVQSATFCEKFSGCAVECQNRYAGCMCRRGQCRTQACPCFTACRECDPDLCTGCVALGDIDPDEVREVDPDEKMVAILNAELEAAAQYTYPSTYVPTAGTKARMSPMPQLEWPKDSAHPAPIALEYANKSVVPTCQNMKLRANCAPKVVVRQSGVSGWGAFSTVRVEKNELLGEYVGEVISQAEADRRGVLYDRIGVSFLFNLNSEYVVDATRKGNVLKFANHSANANCYAKVVNVNGDHRICVHASRTILENEELFYDYRYEEDKAPAWAKDGMPSTAAVFKEG